MAYLVHGKVCTRAVEQAVYDDSESNGEEGQGDHEDHGGVGLEDEYSNHNDLCHHHSCMRINIQLNVRKKKN